MRRRLIAIVVAGVLLAACGGDGDDDAAPVGDETSTSSAGSGASTSGDLKSKLLADADMPSGYKADPSEDDDPTDDGEEDPTDPGELCADVAEFETRFEPQDEAEVNFTKGETSLAGGVFVGESLGRFASEARANEAFDFAADAFSKCKQFDTKDADGSTFKGTFAKRPVNKVGDETFAARLEGEAGTAGFKLPLKGTFVFVREGNVVMLIAGFGFGEQTVADNELEQIIKKAHSKL